MPVESAADRASFFAAGEFAEAASYTAPGGGAAVPCTIVYDRGQAKNRFAAGEAQMATAERKAWINADDVAEVATRGTLVVPVDDDLDPLPGAETLEVVGAPILDETGAVWAVDLVLVD